MESALRTAEEQALAGVAQTLAASLQGRADLLYRAANGDVAQFSDYDLAPIVLPGAPVLDGYADDWPESPSAWKTFDQGSDRLRVLTGLHERMLYLLLEVRDHRVVFDARDATPLEPETFGDRIWLGFSNPEGAEHQVLIAATSAGPIQARHIETREFGQAVSVSEPRIAGAWQLKSAGYRVELRVPLSMLGARLGVLVDDRDQRGAAPASYGSIASATDLHTRGRLIAAAPELSVYLNQFLQPGLLLVIATPRGLPLAQASEPAADTLTMSRELPRPSLPAASRPARRAARSRGNRAASTIASTPRDRPAAASRKAPTAGSRCGTVRSRRCSTSRWSRASSRCSRCSRSPRIWRCGSRGCGSASESALTRAGLVTTFPETEARTSWATSRAASRHCSPGSTNTPATCARWPASWPMRSARRSPSFAPRSKTWSPKPPSAAARAYLDRAREGSERLNAILVAMGAATRVEEAINGAERSRFDLVPVLGSAAVAAYRGAFPARAFGSNCRTSPLSIEGAPDLIVQMLDKLIDNAVDFSPSGSTITVRLSRDGEGARLEVENWGRSSRKRIAPGSSNLSGNRVSMATAGRISVWGFTS